MNTFANDSEKETFMSLRSLINNNSGFFKSVKQAQYLYKAYSAAKLISPENAWSNYGVEVAEGQVVVTVDSYFRWADYGTRSIIPSIIMFLVDKFGVVSQYKISGNGNLRDGWAPNPEKTKLIWSRPADAVCSWTFEEALEAKSGEWIGKVGDKLEVQLKLIGCYDKGYSQYGQMFLSVFEDSNGNRVNIWKNFDRHAGSMFTVKGTVKSTDEYNGRKNTTLTRVKVIADEVVLL